MFLITHIFAIRKMSSARHCWVISSAMRGQHQGNKALCVEKRCCVLSTESISCENCSTAMRLRWSREVIAHCEWVQNQHMSQCQLRLWQKPVNVATSLLQSGLVLWRFQITCTGLHLPCFPLSLVHVYVVEVSSHIASSAETILLN